MVPVIQPLGYFECSHISRWKSWFLAQLSLFWACEIICRILTFLCDFTWRPLMNWLTLLSCACAMHCTFVTVWPLFCSVLFTFIFWVFANDIVCSCSHCPVLSHFHFFFVTSMLFCTSPNPLFCSALPYHSWRMGNVVLDGSWIKNRVRVDF